MDTKTECRIAVLGSVDEDLIGPFQDLGISVCRRECKYGPISSVDRTSGYLIGVFCYAPDVVGGIWRRNSPTSVGISD
ncbi:MAG: hypothetical protein NZ605_02735 [Acidimicrobiales bacterium]|nr:hypothetical protein [Acidimicrobiales bacterium]